MGESPIQSGFERFLSLTRLLALIPVLFLLFDAGASFVYGTDIMVRSVTGLISEPAQVGGRLGVFLIVMDTFLVGATLMVAAFGFYELFVVQTPRHRYRLPSWLRMHDLEDLKARVVSMLILVAAITFVDRTVESHDEQELLFLGIGISIIIVALTFFLWFGKRNGGVTGAEPAAVSSGGSDDGPAGGGGTSGGGAGSGSDGTAAGPTSGGSAGSGSGTTSGGSAGSAPADPTMSGRRASGATGASGETGGAGPTAEPAPRRGLRLATAQDLPAPDTAAYQEASAPSAASATPATSATPAASGRPRGLTAILGVARRDGDWATAPARALAVAGYARLDLRDSDPADSELKIRASAVFGVVSITVPADTRVAESGLTVLGLRQGHTGAASGSAGRRLVVTGLSVFGVVRVRRQPASLAQRTWRPASAPASAPAAALTVAAPDQPTPLERWMGESDQF